MKMKTTICEKYFTSIFILMFDQNVIILMLSKYVILMNFYSEHMQILLFLIQYKEKF